MSMTNDEDMRDIAILQELNSLATTETPPKDAELSPIDTVESALSKFVEDAMNVTRTDFEFNSKLQEQLLSRLDTLSENHLINLFSNTNVNLNDKLSKVLGPTFQLLISRQQAEMARAQAEQKLGQAGPLVNVQGNADMRAINATVTSEVLQGLTSLSHFITAMQSKAPEEVPNATSPNK